MSDKTEYEYGFMDIGPVPGLMAVTRNPMLAETMAKARPEQPLYRRPVPTEDWELVGE